MKDHNDLPPAEIMKMAQDAINRFGGKAEVHFKYTCDQCGARCTFDDPNILYQSGECHQCGHKQPVTRARLRSDGSFMKTDPEKERYYAELREHAKTGLYPKLAASDVFLSIAPPDDQPDAKFCLELGAAIMFDKPIITLVSKGRTINDHLRRVSDKVIEVDSLASDEAAEAIHQAMMELEPP